MTRNGLGIVEVVTLLVVGLLSQKESSSPSADLTTNNLSVSIGIHTGLTVIGDAGGKPDVFGETPNVAARVQSAAEPDTVVVSAATQRLVAGLFVVEDRGAQQLKGIEQPVQLYRVSGAGVARRRTYAHGVTPFVGRDDELRLLLGRWERVREGQVVLVLGEPGIGKSRLLEEFRTQITPDPHRWIDRAGQQFFENTPFHAVTQMLDQGLGLRGDESKDERVIRLELAPAGVKLGEAVPLIAALLDLPIPETYPPLVFAPDQRRKRRFRLGIRHYPAATLGARTGGPALGRSLDREPAPWLRKAATLPSSFNRHLGTVLPLSSRATTPAPPRWPTRNSTCPGARAATPASEGRTRLNWRCASFADALATIEDALTANPDELVYRPHSLTCRGELRLTLGQSELAQADFRDVIALARTMQAKAFELRATAHLARLLRDTGRREEARTLLPPR